VTPRKGLQYEIKWSGYAETTWEPETSIIEGSEVLTEYWSKVHGDKSPTTMRDVAPYQLPAIPKEPSLDELFQEMEDPVNLIVPNEILEDCTIALRPKPSPAMQLWIAETCGTMDLDLLPFQSKMEFCTRTSHEVELDKELDAIKTVWINPPWSELEKAIRWYQSLGINAVVYMLVPEWMTHQLLSTLLPELRVRCMWPVLLRNDEMFVWPSGEKHVVGYRCRVLKCDC